MGRRTFASLVIAILLFSGCYAAKVDTGRPGSGIQVEKKWAAGWIYGLVPPSTIESAAKCPHGVSKVETKLSFLNMLVSGLTLGIYTPMEIVVTCAAESTGEQTGYELDFNIPRDASSEDIQGVFTAAADLAVEQNRPVLVGRER